MPPLPTRSAGRDAPARDSPPRRKPSQPRERCSTLDATGRLVQPTRITLGEYLALWLAASRNRLDDGLRATGRRDYEVHVRRHITPGIGEVPLQALDRNRVKALRLGTGGDSSAATAGHRRRPSTTGPSTGEGRRVCAVSMPEEVQRLAPPNVEARDVAARMVPDREQQRSSRSRSRQRPIDQPDWLLTIEGLLYFPNVFVYTVHS